MALGVTSVSNPNRSTHRYQSATAGHLRGKAVKQMSLQSHHPVYNDCYVYHSWLSGILLPYAVASVVAQCVVFVIERVCTRTGAHQQLTLPADLVVMTHMMGPLASACCTVVASLLVDISERIGSNVSTFQLTLGPH